MLDSCDSIDELGKCKCGVCVPAEIVLGEHEATIDEVSKIVQELRIVLCHKVSPVECTVLSEGTLVRKGLTVE